MSWLYWSCISIVGAQETEAAGNPGRVVVAGEAQREDGSWKKEKNDLEIMEEK